jgi:two-component system, chemotaxis family, chemotaxis protein CheY
MRPTHILVVDDEAPLCGILAAALTRCGHLVQVAGSGRSAERLLATNSFDVVVTDVIMPDGDGIEMIMNLRAANKHVPIIAMTGVHAFSEVYLKTARALGARWVLSKPFMTSELLEAVENACLTAAPHGVTE